MTARTTLLAAAAPITPPMLPSCRSCRRSRGRRASLDSAYLLLLLAMGFDRAAASETLAAGGDHACAITTTGGVKCWGLNSKGQLGYEDTAKRGADSDSLGAALPYVDLGTGRTAVSITAGDQHTCAVLDEGSLKCWGYGNSGQLGQGDTSSYGNTVATMGDSLDPVDLGTVTVTGATRKAKKAVAGNGFTCVVTEDGQVACFGSNDWGQLGVEHGDDVGKVSTDLGENLDFVDFGAYTGRAVDIASGPCALFDDGSIKCWGFNLYGSTGVPGSVNVGLAAGDMGDALPVIPLGGKLAASVVACGSYHNCAVVDNGKVKCWGKNTQGNLGLGYVHDQGNDSDELGDNLPYTDLGVPAAQRIDGGLDHTCALLEDGTVKCWGKNWNGALGLGDYAARGVSSGQMGVNLPTVFLGTGRTAVEIAVGDNFSCATLDDGGVKCWGDGSQGKLGQGHSQQLGDDALEMESLGAIDLGPGVLGAAPSRETPSPTVSPTVSPTISPTPAPTAGRTMSPTTPSPTDNLHMAAEANQAPAASTPPPITTSPTVAETSQVPTVASTDETSGSDGGEASSPAPTASARGVEDDQTGAPVDGASIVDGSSGAGRLLSPGAANGAAVCFIATGLSITAASAWAWP